MRNGYIDDPLTFSEEPSPIRSVLRHLCSQEGCDGEPYEQMGAAADYIEQLERDLSNHIATSKISNDAKSSLIADLENEVRFLQIENRTLTQRNSNDE